VAVLPATLSAGTRQKRGTSFLLVADRPVGIRNIQFLEEVQPRSVLKPSQAISAFKALLPFSKPSKPSKPKYQHHKDMTRYKTNP